MADSPAFRRADGSGILERFRRSLSGPDLAGDLRRGLIGEGIRICGPFGSVPLVYADYVASGRALRQVEDFVLEEILPYYANTHTEASFCGDYVGRVRRAARSVIAGAVRADDRFAVIFTGAGATSAVNRLIGLLGIARSAGRGERPLVLHGPYEHHTNILPWRESGAEVAEVPEHRDGGPDLGVIEDILARTAGRALRIGTFSAASNVTGIVTDVARTNAVLKAHGALAVWDYAAGGPYLDMNVAPAPDAECDALFFSPHKFVGGPGASGILVVRRSIVATERPTTPGGGTVAFVSPWGHDYSQSLETREEAGTPNIIGDIRAALAILVKEAVGAEFIAGRHAELGERALSAWRRNPRIMLLGIDRSPRLPFFSFRVRDGKGGFVHHQLFTRMLSDVFGIQARGGCACAGPYAHLLMDIDRERSAAIRESIKAGEELSKPGWVRLNFSYLMDDEKADYIVASVNRLAADCPIADRYIGDAATARFRAARRSGDLEEPVVAGLAL